MARIRVWGASGGGDSGGSALYTIDDVTAFEDAFGPASAYDEEFNRTTNPTTLPTGWAAINGNSGTYIEQAGMGTWHIPAGFNSINNVTFIGRDIPVEADWTAWTSQRYMWEGMGIAVTDGTKAAALVVNDNPYILFGLWSNIAGTYDSNPTQTWLGRYDLQYSRIIRHSATDWDFAFSNDGTSWVYLVEGYDLSAAMGGFTPTKIGFLLNQGDGQEDFSMDWFRVREN